jgi:hypothetical protein
VPRNNVGVPPAKSAECASKDGENSWFACRLFHLKCEAWMPRAIVGAHLFAMIEFIDERRSAAELSRSPTLTFS